MECKDCVHWEKPDPNYGEPWRAEFGHCRQTAHGDDLGEWDSEGEWVLDASYQDRTAVVMDSSGWMAYLHTKPDHFCAMFTPPTDTKGEG